ncbi:MAG: DNA polymerase III subunit gamma/tau [Phycisphaerae bacterium]
MAGYLALARKYRSQTFDEVVGQEPIAQTLKNAISSGRIHHAYLFTGTRGVGKTTMARIFAKALNCLSADQATPEPCNECDACVSIGRGDDVDVVEIDGASNRGIDEIRELRANAIYRPSRCRYKIYYIDEVHMLTKEAFNALLKTLEEPPGHVKFIFATTEAEKVPATILSRCQRFDFRNIPTHDIAGHLKTLCASEGVQADDDAIFRIARAGRGSMRDGLSLLDQILAASDNVTDADVIRILGTPSDERTFAIASAIADGDTAAALGGLHQVLQTGVTLSTAVESLATTFRNMMLAGTCGPDTDLIELPETQRKQLGQIATKFSVPTLVQSVGILAGVERSVRGSSVARALVEAAIVRLAEADKFVDPASLIKRLEAMSQGRPMPAYGGQKKKPSIPVGNRTAGNAQPPSRGDGGATPQQQANPAAQRQPSRPAPRIEFTPEWMSKNWPAVVATLSDRGQSRIAGLLKPTRVVGIEDSTLRLEFPAGLDALHNQCNGPMRQAIQGELSKLVGRNIRCVFVQARGNGSDEQHEVAAAAEMFKGLSSDERAKISQDPAVKAVTDLFGGDVVDIRKEVPQVPSVGQCDVDDEEEE